MSSGHRIRPVRPAAYRLLLVLAVLAGVVAMHGLAPGPLTMGVTAAPPAHSGHHAPERPSGTARTAAEHVAGDHCDHLAAPGGGHRGHLEHADPTCAASGVSTAPVPAPLAPGSVEAATAEAPRARPCAATATDRAPPDLARLQLLRI
ncbi:DUF6153 family protein [Streptomyces sp. NPDC046887]|uniref:DUF6153 family protein n=1 Tax=Streptomyces sp. NPDC046887 TaxID=3155472 RepID=UPI0033D39405